MFQIFYENTMLYIYFLPTSHLVHLKCESSWRKSSSHLIIHNKRAVRPKVFKLILEKDCIYMTSYSPHNLFFLKLTFFVKIAFIEDNLGKD